MTYGVILADPPWRFKMRTPEGMSRNPDGPVGVFHYETMDLESIKAMNVQSLTNPSTILFLWATSPMLPEALDVMATWGFKYVSSLVWTKDRIGTGYWVRNQHELVLIGRRSKSKAPAVGLRPASVIEAKRREHSRKPDRMHEIIEACWPDARKLEMFARRARPGWDVFGNEVDGIAIKAQGEPVVSDTVKEVIALYRELRERKEQIEASIKDKVAGIREDMNSLEAWLLEQAEVSGVRSFATTAGTAYIATQDSASVADWDKVLAHAIENENFDLLTHGVNKTAVRGFIEENGAPPPGVNFSSRRTINVRAPAPE